MDIMLLAGLVDIRGACIVEAGEGVVGGVELNVDVADVVSGRPCDGLLEPETAPDIDPDPVPQCHFLVPQLARTSFPEINNSPILIPFSLSLPAPRQTTP